MESLGEALVPNEVRRKVVKGHLPRRRKVLVFSG
jgi:hypothetical protein